MSDLNHGAGSFSPRNTFFCPKLAGGQLTLTVLTVLSVMQASTAMAEVFFNPRFLSQDPSEVADLTGFSQGQEVPPGIYRVDIYLNDGFRTTRDVSFQADEGVQGLVPCLTKSQLSALGVNIFALKGADSVADDVCVSLMTLIPAATTLFDVGEQRLSITIPQAYMGNHARGFIPPERWDNGITAARVNYTMTGNSSRNQSGEDSNSAWLNLQSGLNYGPWRLRDNSTWSYSSGGSTESRSSWQHVNSWLERNFTSINSRLTLGDSYTPTDIFTGVNFRGLQLASDDNMLPDSLRGFAPVVHGIARGTAQVSIRQNGYEIYQTTVPPGPFTINDLYATGSGGDLNVTIKEADGSTQAFSVPFSSVPVLQREGYTRYALTLGEYRSGSNEQDTPGFLQSTVMRGMGAGWTLYGGAQLADKYRAYNLGIGKNMGVLGALSLDVTQANARLPDDSDHQGQSMRFLYNKSLSDLGTNFQLIGYRYSTSGYFNLADTAYRKMKGYSVEGQDGTINVEPVFTDYYNLAYNRRGQIQASVTQQVSSQITLYLNGNRQSYWGTDNLDRQIQAGVNFAVDDINWMASYSMTKSAWFQERNQLVSLNVSIPFSHWLRSDNKSVWKNASVNYNMTDDLNGQMTNLVGLYGTLLADNNLSYSVQTGYTKGGTGNSGDTGFAALDYNGTYGNANVGFSRSRTYNQTYFGVSGGILAHENGVTFSQPLNDTVILIQAPGADNVKVENQTGVTTDWRGYAVLPYATEYRENRIALDANTLADNVDLEDTVASAVPTRGAIVRANFRSHVGMKAVLTLTYKGKPLPFGTIVTTGDSESGSIVADNGQVYLTGLPLSGKLLAKWGEDADKQCTASYQLPAESITQALSEASFICK